MFGGGIAQYMSPAAARPAQQFAFAQPQALAAAASPVYAAAASPVYAAAASPVYAAAASPAIVQPAQPFVYAQPQAAYGQQQVMFAEPQVAYGQQVVYAGQQGDYGQQVVLQQSPGFAPPPMISPAALSKIVEYEGHWKAVKPQLEQMFNQMCPSGSATLAQMVAWFDAVGQQFLGQGLGPFMDGDIYERFDFDGDGSMQWKEAYRCLKRVSTQLLQMSGQAVDTNVPFKTPQQGGYTIIKELARGGQGAALLAQHPQLGECCVKEYDKTNENAGGIEELIAEMDHLKALKSPLVMATYEVFQDTGHYYCVNELLPGGDLGSFRKKCMENRIGFSEPLFRGVFLQCVQALDFIHRNGVMHCDIKEPNVMIKNKDYRNAQICLIDFGLAQDAAGGGQAGGTPGYTPPETCIPPNKWFPRGDVFSMGVVFFQLLADKSPDEKTGKMGIFQEGFTGNIDDIINFVTYRQPPFELIQGKFPGAVGFLSKMLAKQRQQRPKPAQLLQDPWFTSNEVFTAAPMAGAATSFAAAPMVASTTAFAAPVAAAPVVAAPTAYAAAPVAAYSPTMYTPAAAALSPGVMARGVTATPSQPPRILGSQTLAAPRVVGSPAVAPKAARVL